MKNYTITVNGKVYEVTVEEGFKNTDQNASVETKLERPVEVKKTAASAAGRVKVTSPMPGKILDIRTTIGKTVKRGEVLLILEAMKMENEIVAPEDGVVADLCVQTGSSVEAGDILASLN